ncbi:MAG: extracellular solute-binding protein [Pseudomonadota bacterium]
MWYPRRCSIVWRLCRDACFALVIAMTGGSVAGAGDGHGIATHGDLKYPKTFLFFDYVNPEAPKAGTLNLGTMLTFNSTNMMRFPGNTPNEFAYLYDRLMTKAADESGSYYGLLAERAEMTGDGSTLRFALRKGARWHDGTPITAADVVFTFETLGREGLPVYRSILEGVSLSARGSRVIEVTTTRPQDRRFIGLVATFPIHPAHVWSARDLSALTLEPPLGSGPYRLASMALNQRLVLERVPDYWGRSLPVNRGRWNFDRIEVLYFRDRAPIVEALKAGRLNLHREYDATNWAERYDGPAFVAGDLVKTEYPTTGRLDALVFNLRRAPLDDVRVREALTLAFDREWARETFFAGLYPPPGSLYGKGSLAAVGAPGPGERAILEPFRAELPAGLFDAAAPPDMAAQSRRQRLARADALLVEAGFVVRDGVRVKAENNTPLRFSFVGGATGIERTLGAFRQSLQRLGITLDIRLMDYVTLRKAMLSHQFDIAQSGFTPSFPPGTEERLGWHSERAGTEGYGLAGAVDPVLDAAIEAMSDSNDPDRVIAGARAFDRVMRWRRYLLPLWQRSGAWIAHDRRIAFPDGYSPGRGLPISTLWWED